MKEYIERIDNSGLDTIKKRALKMCITVTELYEQLKAEGKEPDRIWLESELKKYGD